MPAGEPIHFVLEPRRTSSTPSSCPGSSSSATRSRGAPTCSTSTSNRPGRIGGQCAEFCGVGHDQMPFTVRAVSPADYDGVAGVGARRRRSGPRLPQRATSLHRPAAMTTACDHRSTGRRPRAQRSCWLTTTDHKRIGILYIGHGLRVLPGRRRPGAADARRAGPARSPAHVGSSSYNQLFTMHGTLMMLLFADADGGRASRTTSCRSRSARADMAFPRLNALSYWLFLFGGLIVLSGFLTAGGAAAVGWTGYAPLSERRRTRPAPGIDLWIVGLLAHRHRRRSSARSTSSPRSSCCARPG